MAPTQEQKDHFARFLNREIKKKQWTAAGTPVKIVSERLGHRKTETTSNLYQHVDVSLQRAAVNALEERIERTVNE